MLVIQVLHLLKEELASCGKYFVLISVLRSSLSCDFKPLVDLIAREWSLQTIEFRHLRQRLQHVIFSMHNRALIRLGSAHC
jgi:hypothetical protein